MAARKVENGSGEFNHWNFNGFLVFSIILTDTQQFVFVFSLFYASSSAPPSDAFCWGKRGEGRQFFLNE